GSTVIPAIIDLIAKTIQDRLGHGTRGQTQNITLELSVHHGADHFGQTLDGFKHDVADKAITYDDVDRALENIVSLDVAIEVQVTLAQQLSRLFDDLVTLDNFFADIEKPDAGLRAPIQRGDERRPHKRELQQVLCRAIDIRAQIEHGGRTTLLIGDRGGNSWA